VSAGTEIGQAFRDRRADTVGGREVVAARTDLDLQTVVDIETGLFDRVSFATVERYCEAIGLDVVLQEHGR